MRKIAFYTDPFDENAAMHLVELIKDVEHVSLPGSYTRVMAPFKDLDSRLAFTMKELCYPLNRVHGDKTVSVFRIAPSVPTFHVGFKQAELEQALVTAFAADGHTEVLTRGLSGPVSDTVNYAKKLFSDRIFNQLSLLDSTIGYVNVPEPTLNVPYFPAILLAEIIYAAKNGHHVLVRIEEPYLKSIYFEVITQIKTKFLTKVDFIWTDELWEQKLAQWFAPREQ